MPRILSRKAFEPFQEAFSQKLNTILKSNTSQWHFDAMRIFTHNMHINIGLVFYTVENIWNTKAYTIDYEGNLLNVDEFGLSDDKNFPFKDDYFVTFDVDPYMIEFLETVAIEAQKKRTACIVSNRIRKELLAVVWRPDRVEKWLEAGVELEDL